MAKIGSQNRLLIPTELTSLLGMSGTVGIFWDEEEKKIYLNHLNKKNEEFCIITRKIDNKNRICIPDNVLELINASRTSKFVIAVKKHRIYIFKADENRS